MTRNELTAEQIAEGQARDAATLARWEAERKARMQNAAAHSGMSAEAAATRYIGKNWDATYPSHIRVRHNLGGR